MAMAEAEGRFPGAPAPPPHQGVPPPYQDTPAPPRGVSASQDVPPPPHGEPSPGEQDSRRRAEQRCLEAEQRCFLAERRRFDAERRREQVEALLEQALRAGERMAEIVGELRRLIVALRQAAEKPPAQEPEEEHDGEEVVDALAAAVERLRSRVEAVAEPAEHVEPAQHGECVEHIEPVETAEQPLPEEPAEQQAQEELAERRSPLLMAPAPPVPARPPHKHTMSWVGRWRARRKQRR